MKEWRHERHLKRLSAALIENLINFLLRAIRCDLSRLVFGGFQRKHQNYFACSIRWPAHMCPAKSATSHSSVIQNSPCKSSHCFSKSPPHCTLFFWMIKIALLLLLLETQPIRAYVGRTHFILTLPSAFHCRQIGTSKISYGQQKNDHELHLIVQ